MPNSTKKPLAEADANATHVPAAPTPGKKSADKPKPTKSAPASKKRKSDAAAAEDGDAAPSSKKSKTSKASKPDPLDVSGVTLDGEEDHSVPVFDTCDAVRRKINAILRKDGVTKAGFLRAAAAASRHDGTIGANSLNNFLRSKGALKGNTNAVYYHAYVFFEKLRLKQGKPKDKLQEGTEKANPQGINTERSSDHIIVLPGESVSFDKFGALQVKGR